MKKIFVLTLALLLGGQTYAQSTTLTLGESWENDSWINYSRQTATYDVNNYLIHETGTRWNSSSSDWDNLYQRSYVNNIDGTVQECTHQTWQGTWQNSQHTTYTYNNAGKVVTTLVKLWVNNAWENGFQQTDVYDGNNYQIQHIAQMWASNAWENFTQTLYTNNPDGTVNQELIQRWNTTTLAWEDDTRITHTYLPNGKILTSIIENKETGNWQNLSKREYTYDANNNVTSDYVSLWSNSMWSDPVSGIISSYDANDNLAGELYQQWDNSNNAWGNFLRVTYVRSDVTSVHTSAVTQIILYPNPTSDLISIQGNHNLTGETYTMTDAMGKVVLTGTLTNENSSVSIGTLNNGIYCLHVGNSVPVMVIKK